jgi:transposase
MKKANTASFKALVVLELLKEIKAISQLASEHGVAVTVLREWKLAAIKGLADAFERWDSVAEFKATHERQLQDVMVASNQAASR